MVPKVLIISNNCFSKTDSNGRTLGNLLRGWPKSNLAQFYIQNAVPDSDYCEQYYRNTDHQALTALIGKQNNGIPSKVNFDSRAQTTATVHKKTRNAFSMMVRDAVWRTGRWKSHFFDEWVSSFHPDIVVLQAGDCPFMFHLAADIAEQYQAKFLIYNTEGYYFKNYDYFRAMGIAHVLYPLFYRRLKHSVERAYNSCDYAVFNCEELESEYKKVFAIKSRVIYNASSITLSGEFDLRRNDIFTTVYAGNMGVGRAESLVMVAKALQAIDSKYKIQVYGKIPDEDVAELFSRCSGIDYRGFISYAELISIQRTADLLLQVESFEPFYRRDSQFAFSTKIPDSMALGRCFLVFAPGEFASSSYLAKNHAAHVVTNQDALQETLQRIIEDETYRNQYLQNARELVRKNHHQAENAAAFQNILDQLCE